MSRTQKVAVFLTALFTVVLSGTAVIGIALGQFYTFFGVPPWANLPEMEVTQYVVAGLQQEGLLIQLRLVQTQILQYESERKNLGNKFEDWKQKALEKAYNERKELETLIKKVQEKEKPVKK